MTISVIIPTYNRAATIRRSIMSVLGQTIEELELIVVDDCSTDDTAQIVRSIPDKRLKYVCLEKNSGACVARNRGIELAEGDLIAFQDSDDEWVRNKLEVQLAAMKENGADICSCCVRRHYPGEHGKVIVWPEPGKIKEGFLTHVQIRRRSYMSTQTIVAKREVFVGHKFDPKLKKSQDYDWGIRASKDHSVYFTTQVLVEQYLQKDSITVGGAGKIVEAMQYLLNKHRDIAEEDPEFKLHLLKFIAHNKVICARDPYREYKEILKLEKNFHNLLCVVLARMKLIRFVIRK